jgi:pimeloyl-ACP methyl ester carboxylesterase
VTLADGPIRYHELGEGPAVVFVHGFLVNADLWRAVVPDVAQAGFRCTDWPLGSHESAVPRADLSPPGLAALIAAFFKRLDLRDVTIVANDTGGASPSCSWRITPSASAAWSLGVMRRPGAVLPAGLRSAPWAEEDRLFPIELAHRSAGPLPPGEDGDHRRLLHVHPRGSATKTRAFGWGFARGAAAERQAAV